MPSVCLVMLQAHQASGSESNHACTWSAVLQKISALSCPSAMPACQRLIMCGSLYAAVISHSMLCCGCLLQYYAAVKHRPCIAGLGSTIWPSFYLGFRRTRMTESPLMKSLGMKRSLLTGVEPFLPLPVLGICSMNKGGDT